MSLNLRWFGLLTLVVAAFFWKILFTSQFSMIIGWEGANQAYAWYNYAARSIQQGILPLWDPFTHSGYTFVGETQTGVFYPLKFLLYLSPFTDEGFLSERVFHQVYVLAHLLGAVFMFLCARELGIRSHFAAFISAVCFTLGGFAGKQGWVHQMDSLIWLPLVFLFVLRALRAETGVRRVLNACYSGLCLGISLLAGSMHVPYMSVIFLVSAALFFAAARPDHPPQASQVSNAGPLRPRLIASAVVIGVVGVVSFAASSLQLLPSMEYAPLATRWTLEWSGEFHQIIPYHVAGGLARMTPRAVFAFLFGMAETGGAEFGPYFGVMPLLLTVIGLWRNWVNPWVKFLGVVALLAFVQGLGSYSLLHGVLYVAVPYIDKLWEAGRFIFLTHFAMALLVGFGVQSLFMDSASETCFTELRRILKWIVTISALALGIVSLLGKPELSDWPYVSFLFIAVTWTVFEAVLRGNRTRLAQFVLAAVIVLDLYAFNFIAQNKMEESKKQSNHLAVMQSLRPVADFLHAQPGPLRVHPDSDFSPINWGDVYGVQSTRGYGATMLTDYLPALFSANGPCLFNARYFVGKGADHPGVNPVFISGEWKVYENPIPCPRAWIPQRVVVDSPDNIRRRVKDGGFDPLAVAYVSESLPASLDASLSESVEEPMDVPPASPVITYGRYRADEMEVDVEASATGLLVLSEVYYPGWTAAINGTPVPIYEVNSILRGVIVLPGANRIVMEYRPASVQIGAVLTALAFLGTLVLAGFVFWKEPAKTP